MLTFHGGLSLEQVKKFKNNEYIIFDMIPYKKILIPYKNTFDYYPRGMEFKNYDEKFKYVANDIYKKQYIFLFKYLYNALEFCHNRSERNYILVADIKEEILNNYIGAGRYINNKIEYRVPRKFITKENIVDFLYYEPWDDEPLPEFRKRVQDSYFNKTEDNEANEIIKTKRLVFNGDKYCRE